MSTEAPCSIFNAANTWRSAGKECEAGWALAKVAIKCLDTVAGGASAVMKPGHFEVRESSSQVRSPGVPDAAKGSPVLNDLTDLHCTFCTGCMMKKEKVN